MRLYEGSSQQFIEDTRKNKIVDKLETAFRNYYGHSASPSEINSWNNSLQFLKNVIEDSKLFDNMLILEYELPYSTQRIDCIIFGKGLNSEENVVIIELKQWSKVNYCDIENSVETFVGGANRIEPHPSYKVQAYHMYLQDFIDLFNEESVNLSSCVYCHNYKRESNSALFDVKFKEVLEKHPVFSKDDVEELGKYLRAKLCGGKGLELFNRFVTSRIKPSKKLLDYTSRIIKGQPAFYLIDDQLDAYYTILDRAKKASKLKRKSVILVRGGPGTGKSVIALNVLAELLSMGLTVFHATGSAAFTKTLRKIVGTRAASHFKFFNSFSTAKENELDVLICDEAHRIRKTSAGRYTKKELRSDRPQIDELMRVAKVVVFFIDDYQVVRPTEIGSSDLIRRTALKFNAEFFEFQLKTQFRCSGSDGYLNWVDNILGIRDTANIMLTRNEKMEFRIFDSPHELYEKIKEKNRQKPNSARLVAGFCWPWSDPNSDGTLKDDVVIGDFRMPWEGKENKKLAKGIPPAPLWAATPEGVNQIGSIYTVQGFEFDYIGVIFGNDLVYDPEKKEWVGKPENSADPMLKKAKDFTKYVKNVYRVLLTRGMKGCYVYFLDKNTENFFKSRIKMD